MAFVITTIRHIRKTSSDKRIVFPSYVCLIFSLRSRKCHRPFRIAIGLWLVGQPYPRAYALYVVSVRRGRCLPKASFRFHLAMDTLVSLAIRFPLSGAFGSESAQQQNKTLDNQQITKRLKYPEPGSNRHGLPHWCLRPARLPIPPSGLFAVQRYT